MKKYFVILILAFITLSCKGQTETTIERTVGGPCEDCDATLDYKLLNLTPKPIDTLPGFNDNAPKIKITGTVYHKDGTTPAKDILLYVYHVDSTGIYKPGAYPVGWEKRHGQYRSWLKTNADGKFTFYTFRPAAYPNRQEPEHIHIYVKEPNTIPYYLDSYLFTDDPLLSEAEKATQDNRGGSGIITLEMKNGILTAHRDITLGLHIPDYD